MIMEAVAVKSLEEEQAAQKQAEIDQWKHDDAGLEELRNIAGN